MKFLFLPTILGIGLLALVLSLFKKRKLQNKHAYLWIFISSSVFASGLFIQTRIINRVSKFFGVVYPPSLFFVLGLFLLLLLILNQSMTLSKQEQEITKLTQRVALQQQEIEALKHSQTK